MCNGRIMIAGTNSGCGKTTVVCGLLKCLLNRKMNIHAFKCGPDYIDTSFHKKVLKIPTGNLDSWFCKPEDLRKIVSKKADKCDIAVIEGVMGYYDGMGFTQRASAYEIADITSTPVILIINCKGMSSSLEAVLSAIFNEQGEIPLDGTWSYCIGAACEHVPETDFVNWKPTGLYNGMTAPCHKYTIAGVNWYQGESNTHHPDNYLDLLRRMIEGYRKEWNDPKLPFQIVELPNLMVDMEGAEEGWRVLRELQRRSAVFPDVDVAVTIDLGEDNDLHPQNKKDLGKRLALLAAARLGIPVESKGPEVTEITVASDEANNLRTIRLTCSHAEGLHASSEDKGEEILDFEVVNDNGEVLQPKTQIKGQEIVLTIPDKETEVKLIRYCYRTSNIGALVYNQAGLPMSPFVRRVYEETV